MADTENENACYKFYENVLGSPKHILAPMVEQSELPFRMLCRNLGAQLCYTPMWHAAIFVKDEKYRNDAIDTIPNDRPLLFQFCANDPETFAKACALAEPHCDGVDLNLGCPQAIANRGHYGAFLMEEWELIGNIIKTASERISKPITCKIRVYKSIEKTVEYVKLLEKAGAKIITVHGRAREQKGPLTGIACWEHIKAVKENVTVPVFANGNIQNLADIKRCFEYTKVDGVMSAEGALCNPAIFTGRQPPVWEMADEYIKYAEKYNTLLGSIRGHLFRLWHHCLCKYKDLREPMGVAKSFDNLKEISNQLKERCQIDAKEDIEAGLDSEDPRKLPYWRCQPYVRPKQKNAEQRVHDKNPTDKPLSKRKLLRKKHHEHGKGIFPKTPKEKWPICQICRANPWGVKCSYNRCRTCCRKVSSSEVQDCPGHRLYFYSNMGKPRKPNTKLNNEMEIKSTDSEVHALDTSTSTIENMEYSSNTNTMKSVEQSLNISKHGTSFGIDTVTEKVDGDLEEVLKIT